MHAYDEIYVAKAQVVMGQMLRYAEEDLQLAPDYFFKMFLDSGVARLFGNGDYRFIVGMSGPEVVREVFWRMWGEFPEKGPSFHMDKSPIYWAGWVLSYYQWYTGQSFERIYSFLRPEEIRSMYTPYHEMDLQQFVDAANRRIREHRMVTRLKAYRESIGMSQNALSNASGISVRMIQHYEQRQKNINHAQADTIRRLARVLHCSMEDLLEFEAP